mmetsp:Transcript_65037/g.174644  ORF Transcript_65037/g.174644 Transcript_65037/m.174644 type:complete len:114 (+) Transcript_65037:550-891(+)
MSLTNVGESERAPPPSRFMRLGCGISNRDEWKEEAECCALLRKDDFPPPSIHMNLGYGLSHPLCSQLSAEDVHKISIPESTEPDPRGSGVISFLEAPSKPDPRRPSFILGTGC